MSQAEWLGESLQNEPIDRIYSSSSQRTLRTAELIRATRQVEITGTDALREINLGIWEGRSQEEVKVSHPEQFDYFWNDPEKFGVEDSETFQEVYRRSMRVLDQIIGENQGKSVLIVTHTVVVKLIMAYFEGRPLKEIWNPPYIHPACLCKVELTMNKPEIILHGDINHYRAQPVSD
jgi:probable phosphoglycerate mutase